MLMVHADSTRPSAAATSRPRSASARSFAVSTDSSTLLAEPHANLAIAGWDEGVLSVDGGMSLGEKATLTITGYAMNSH